ncbi:hypothetical protein PMAYCL1PPCAC_10928, partial [Pristionchus mayeri]
SDRLNRPNVFRGRYEQRNSFRAMYRRCMRGFALSFTPLQMLCLIHRTIFMSGNAYSRWAHKKSIAAYCKNYAATKLGIKSTSSRELIAILRSVPADQLKVAVPIHDIRWRETTREFCPVIDGDLLPLRVEELRRIAPVLSVMAGVTELEAARFLRPQDAAEDNIIATVEEMLPKGTRNETRDSLVRLYKESVLRRQPDLTLWRARTELSGDRMYCIPTIQLLRECNKRGAPTYFYVFAYYNAKSVGGSANFPHVSEAPHAFDLPYVFKSGIYWNVSFNDNDNRACELITTAFAIFDKNGNPNGKGSSAWLPCDIQHPGRHMIVGLNPKMEVEYKDGICQRWIEIIENEKLRCSI